MKVMWVQPLGQEDPLGRKWQPTPGFLPGTSHGQRSLAGYSPWGLKRVRCDLATKQQYLLLTFFTASFQASRAREEPVKYSVQFPVAQKHHLKCSMTPPSWLKAKKN